MTFSATDMPPGWKGVATHKFSTDSYVSAMTITDDAGVERTLRVSYQACVRLAEFTQPLLPGFRGRAIIHAGSQSLGQRLWRLANNTFRFR